MIDASGPLPRERLAERYLVLTTTRDLFPKCCRCGRDLSGHTLASLTYVASRNRFACPICPLAAD